MWFLLYRLKVYVYKEIDRVFIRFRSKLTFFLAESSI